MPIHVEFFGIVREKTGVAAIDVEAATLGEVFSELERRFPRLVPACLRDGRIQSGYLANIDGRSFTTDPSTVLEPGADVLILSADAGG